MDKHMQRLADYFAIGKVIYNSYWQSYDIVLGFSPVPKNDDDWRAWYVTVIPCDKDGVIDLNSKPREHCTNPFIK